MYVPAEHPNVYTSVPNGNFPSISLVPAPDVSSNVPLTFTTSPAHGEVQQVPVQQLQEVPAQRMHQGPAQQMQQASRWTPDIFQEGLLSSEASSTLQHRT